MKKVGAILDAATAGSINGLHTIASAAEVSSSTVFDVLKDFPLWEYARKKLKGKL